MRTRSTLDWSQSNFFCILLHTVHWSRRWQDRCCRASRELCSNYL